MKKVATVIFLSMVVVSCKQKVRTHAVNPYKEVKEPKAIEAKTVVKTTPSPVPIEIEQITAAQFQSAKKQEVVNAPVEKITDFQIVQKQLAGVVDFNVMDGYLGVKKINFRNGTSSGNTDQLDEYTFVAYFPTEDILLLEGGHTTDASFDLSTGQKTYDAGNPDLVTISPGAKYRLNKVFEGQECFYHFIQKKVHNKFQKVFELNEIFEKKTNKWLCVIEKEFWTDDYTLYFGLVTQYKEEGNEYEFYKVKIIDK